MKGLKMKRTAIKGKKIITPDGLTEGCVIVKNGKISEVCRGVLPEGDFTVWDAGENYVSPGFIDIHTHGAGGYDFMDGTQECIIQAAKTHLKHGTTSIVPTTLTSTKEELFQTIDNFKAARDKIENGPCLLGLHLEGPYFSMNQRGAQDPNYIKSPDKEEYREIVEYAEGSVIRWSIAPELDGAMELGDYLTAGKILPSIGHSDAQYHHVLEAYHHGYRLLTHFYCGMSGLTRKNGYRRLGVIESGYLIEDMDVEIIADGCHLPPELLKLIYKGKGAGHIILVTDSMRGADMPDGRSVLGSLKNGQEVLIEDGVAKLCDRSAFAGSVATADRLVRVMSRETEAGVQMAVRMITENPARLLGLRTKGKIERGLDADIILFDNDINIKRIMVGGREV